MPTPPPAVSPGTAGATYADMLVINPSRTEVSTAAAIATAESALDVELPRAYRKFVTTYGGGSLGHFIGIYTPEQVASETARWRDRSNRYWFWDMSGVDVTQEDLLTRGVTLASSFDGDELLFDPSDGGTFYVLPRNEDVAHGVGHDFIAALDWLLSGRLNPWTEGWTFETQKDRANRYLRPDDVSMDDAIAAVETELQPPHAVRLDRRTTYFVPAIQGRLSLYGEQGAPGVSVDFTYDEDADPAEVQRVLDAVGGN